MVSQYVSLRQPWATLFVCGAKRIETRSWPTNVRGRLAVHAGAALERAELDAFYQRRFLDVLGELGFPNATSLPRGALLGWVTIENCLQMTLSPVAGPGRISLANDPRLTEQEREFGRYEVDRYAWTTSEDRRVLAAPIPMRAFQRVQALPHDVARWMST